MLREQVIDLIIRMETLGMEPASICRAVTRQVGVDMAHHLLVEVGTNDQECQQVLASLRQIEREHAPKPERVKRPWTYSPTEEHRAKISRTLKGRKPSAEANAKRSAALKGHSTSQATRDRISDSLKGHTMSDETRRKIAESLRRYQATKRTAST